MPATPGEQLLLAELSQLSAGQATGSFGPGQALALLGGYIKLRDRVDSHDQRIGALEVRVAMLEEGAGELQAAEDATQTAVAEVAARDEALEERATGLETETADHETRLEQLDQRVTALETPTTTAPA